MPAFVEIPSGTRFGRLTAIGPASPGNSGQARWACLCDCGNKTTPVKGQLLGGGSKSCGCARYDTLRVLMTTHGHTQKGRRLREYWIWAAMKDRCQNRDNKDFRHYGGRGIKVCARWQKFENFYADMGPRPSRQHSLERKKNGLSYTPKNCIWAKSAAQARNRRTNINVVLNGRKMVLKDAAVTAGVDYHKLWRLVRLKNMRVDHAVAALR